MASSRTTAAATRSRQSKPLLPEWARSGAAELTAHWLKVVAKDYYPYGFFDALKLTPRLYRLFAVACCRHPLIDSLLTDPRSRTAVDVAEQYADGLCGDAVLRKARDDAWDARRQKWDLWRATAADADATATAAAAAAADATATATAAAATAATATAADAADAAAAATATAADAADAAADATATAADATATAARAAMREHQGRLLVALVGPGWLFSAAWRTDTAVALARHVYDARDWGAVPVLADALEDAGCDQGELLALMRDPAAVWFRGARVLDELLGKRD